MSPSATPSPALALVVIGAWQDASSSPSIDDRSTLARIASFGRISLIPYARERTVPALQMWQVGLLDALGLSERCGEFPSAAVSHCGESQTIPPAPEYWTHLACVHFAAGMNDLVGSMLAGGTALTAQDRAEIAAILAPHLASYGYELYATQGDEWRVRCPRAIDAQTLPPAAAFGGSLKDALPSGSDAAELRRLMTEMQMLLHEHPVNARRARAQLPSANGTWMWSVANLTRAVSDPTLPAAFGDESYLKGVYLLHSQTVRAEAFDIATLGEAARASPISVAVVKPTTTAALEADWLRPLLDAVRAGAFVQLTVYLDRWRFALRRRDLLRFWRRPSPVSGWPT